MSNYTKLEDNIYFLNDKNIVQDLNDAVGMNPIASYDVVKQMSALTEASASNLFVQLTSLDNSVYLLSNELSDTVKSNLQTLTTDMSATVDIRRAEDKTEVIDYLSTYANSLCANVSAAVAEKHYLVSNDIILSYYDDVDEQGATNKYIALKYKDGSVISRFGANAFIKDGMISEVKLLKTRDEPPAGENGPWLRIVFNVDAGKETVYLNVEDLIDIYTSNTPGVSVDNKNIGLDFNVVATKDDIATVNASIAETNDVVNNLSALVSSDIEALSTALSTDINALSDEIYNSIDDLGSSISTDVIALSVALSTDISALDIKVDANKDSANATMAAIVATYNEKSLALSNGIQTLSDCISADVIELSANLSIDIDAIAAKYETLKTCVVQSLSDITETSELSDVTNALTSLVALVQQ